MPIYEYVCEACGRIAEVMQRMSDPAPQHCPECGEPRLARLVSRTTFQLKGGGWYSDLYGSAKQKPGPAGGGDGKGAGASAAPDGAAAKGESAEGKGAGAPAAGTGAPAGST